jgi:ATP-dependent Clp protease adaptor protein ClpS
MFKPYNVKTSTWQEQDVALLEEPLEEEKRDLVVYNDDVNTFHHVIETLMKVCKHTPEQAEQCTLLIHYKGKCNVKVGSWEELVPMRQGIFDRGVSAEII